MDETNNTGREKNGRFAKGNLFSLGGYNNGRPPKYEDPEKMFEKIGEYLEWEDAQVSGGQGKGKYSLEGCALFLGFASVQSMYDYEKRSADFSYVIDKFRLFMRKWVVDKLFWGGSTQGAIFWLKNKADYKDEVIQQQNQTITKVEPKIIDGAPPLGDNYK
jgi:hypothetical protein